MSGSVERPMRIRREAPGRTEGAADEGGGADRRQWSLSPRCRKSCVPSEVFLLRILASIDLRETCLTRRLVKGIIFATSAGQLAARPCFFPQSGLDLGSTHSGAGSRLSPADPPRSLK